MEKERLAAVDEGRLEELTRAAEGLVATVGGILGDREQFYKYILPCAEVYDPPVTDSQGRQVKQRRWSQVQVLSRADTRSIREAAQALKSLVSTLRDLYALPTQAQAHRQRMDERRLELLESRAGEAEALAIALDGGAEELAL